ncbi:MAG: putative branched-chain amino acid transporter integral rane subunit [Subtercola sp.]|nr:putative branched-chain amino acid transporter integral rane subunit [Subtercola sp.]
MDHVQLWFSVVEQACFFGLLGLAYMLILEGAGFFNFAIGAYAMIGGLAAASFAKSMHLPVWLAVIAALVLAGLLAAFTEVGVVRPIQRRSGGARLPALVAVIAMLFAITQVAGLLFGRKQLAGQQLLVIDPLQIAGAYVSGPMIVTMALALVSFVGVSVWVRVTGTGRMLRAVGDNRPAAQLLGLPTSRVRITAFVIAGVIAAFAGISYAAKGGVSWDRGLGWALLGFLALVIGGSGSWWAPLLGGLILALLQVFVPFYLSGQFSDYAILAIALIFFAFRPRGLITRQVRI